MSRNKKHAICFLLALFFVFGEKTEAAILVTKPSQTEVPVGNIVHVQVSVDTAGKVINNAESIIQFPKDLLEVVSLDKRSSIFSLWVEEPSFSNDIGQAVFNGGVPNPGFNGSNGNIISIIFRAKKAGTALIAFSDSTVRENDGLGTDTFSGQRDAIINIVIKDVTPEVLPPVDNVPKVPVIKPETRPAKGDCIEPPITSCETPAINVAVKYRTVDSLFGSVINYLFLAILVILVLAGMYIWRLKKQNLEAEKMIEKLEKKIKNISNS